MTSEVSVKYQRLQQAKIRAMNLDRHSPQNNHFVEMQCQVTRIVCRRKFQIGGWIILSIVTEPEDFACLPSSSALQLTADFVQNGHRTVEEALRANAHTWTRCQSCLRFAAMSRRDIEMVQQRFRKTAPIRVRVGVVSLNECVHPNGMPGYAPAIYVHVYVCVFVLVYISIIHM